LCALLITCVGIAYGASPAMASGPPQTGFHVKRGDGQHLSAAKDGGASFVVLVFSWRDIEPVEGYLYWETPDAALRAADYYGLEVVARLDQPPDWALAEGGSYPWDVDAYADFARQVADRYGDELAGIIV